MMGVLTAPPADAEPPVTGVDAFTTRAVAAGVRGWSPQAVSPRAAMAMVRIKGVGGFMPTERCRRPLRCTDRRLQPMPDRVWRRGSSAGGQGPYFVRQHQPGDLSRSAH